jgi:hypothetical protein
MFRAVEKPIPFFTIAARKSGPSPYEDRGLPIRIAAKEKEIKDQMAANDKEARANRLSARNAKKEELEAKEDK